jgi:hypothetical protein
LTAMASHVWKGSPSPGPTHQSVTERIDPKQVGSAQGHAANLSKNWVRTQI